MTTGPMTFFQRMQAKTAESSRHDPALRVRSDKLPSPTSSLTAASPHPPAYATSVIAPAGVAGVKSISPRLSPESHILERSPAVSAKMSAPSKENIALNENFKAAAAKSKIRVSSPGHRPEESFLEASEVVTVIEKPFRMLSPVSPPVKLSATQEVSENSPIEPEKNPEEDPAVSVADTQTISESQQIEAEKAEKTPKEDPAVSIAGIRSEIQAFKFKILTAFDAWDERLQQAEQTGHNRSQDTAQSAAPTSPKAAVKAEPTLVQPAKPASPKYTLEQMRSIDDHITVKFRIRDEEETLRSYRFRRDETVDNVFKRVWKDFETSTGRRDQYYLRMDDTILSSRRKLKDYDINEGDVLDIVEDTEY